VLRKICRHLLRRLLSRLMRMADDGHTDRASHALLLLCSAVFLGHALQLGNGTLANSSIDWLTASLLFCVCAIFLPRIARFESFARKNFSLFAAVGITWQFYAQITSSPGAYIDVNVFRTFQTFILFMTICCACALSALGDAPPMGRATIAIFLLSFTMSGFWLLRVDTNPAVDVHVFHRDSTIALLQGKNPYTLTFPDILSARARVNVYTPEISNGKRILVGFPYMPLTLIFSTLAQWTTGDYRVAHLLALPVAGMLMVLCRRSRAAIVAAAIFLLTPRIFLVLEQGYTEPFVIAFFAASIYAVYRRPRLAALFFGLFIASKQYAILGLSMMWLLLPTPRERIRFSIIACLIALAITLPFFLWSVSGFTRSAILMQLRQPFRDDALSFLAWIKLQSGHQLPAAIGFLAALIAGIACWLRAVRTPAGVASCIALVFFAFFAFNKQAFANYYIFIIGAICCAIAANTSIEESKT
jgi:hypothetical protein